MLFRAPIATLFTLCLLALTATAQNSSDSQVVSPASSQVTGLRGTVLSADGHPASGIHIELDEASTAVPVTSTYTERDGSFALYNIPQGNYEVVAESLEARATNQIRVEPGESQLRLKLLRNQAPMDEMDPTISVARMIVPQSAQKLLRKAQSSFTKHQFDKAKSQVDQALVIEPNFADALLLRGFIETRESELALAQQDLERAVQIDPACTSAYVALAAIYNHQGRFDDAARVSERSLSLSPKSWQGYFELAKASIAKGMYTRGLQLARQAQRLSGNSFAAIHLVKAYAYVPMKFYKDAKYELQTFLSREPNSSGAKQAQMLLAQIEAGAPELHPDPK